MPRTVFALALVLACAPSRKVIVGGVEMRADEAAQLEVGQAQKLLEQGRAREAAEAASDVALRYADTETADDALYLSGWALEQAGDLPGAEAAYKRLLVEHPGSDRARGASLQLALVQIKGGQPADGVPALAALYDQAPEEEKLPAALALGEGSLAIGQPAGAVRWFSAAAAFQQGAEREATMQRAVGALDQAPFLEVARLKEELPRGTEIWTAAALKMARIHHHLRDHARALASAAEAAGAQNGGLWAAQAQSLLARLQERTKVDPLVIGVVVPTSGKYKSYGNAILDGIGLAADLSGKGALKIVVKDTRGEPEGAVAAVEELVEADHAVVVIGPVLASEAVPAATKADELGVPMISLSRVEKLTEIGPFVFRNQLTNSAQAEALARYAVEKLKAKKFAILLPDIAYGHELADLFWDQVTLLGGEVRGIERYPHDETTFASYVKKLVGRYHLDERQEYLDAVKKARDEVKDPYRLRKELEKLESTLPPVVDFDAIFIPDSYRTATLLAPAIAVEDVITNLCDAEELEKVKKTTKRPDLKPVVLLGANGWNHPDLATRGGKYVMCSVFVDGFFENSGRRETHDFVERFQETYGRAPGLLEASAYDSMRMVRTIAEKLAPQDRDAFRLALTGVKSFPGATGELTFGADREARRPLFFLTVDKAGIREIPESGAGGD